jgi:hypothetical protein
VCGSALCPAKTLAALLQGSQLDLRSTCIGLTASGWLLSVRFLLVDDMQGSYDGGY